MIRFLLVFMFSFSLVNSGDASFKSNETGALSYTPATIVYICAGGTAYAYHKFRNCFGLNNCTHEIIKITIKELLRNTYVSPVKGAISKLAVQLTIST